MNLRHTLTVMINYAVRFTIAFEKSLGLLFGVITFYRPSTVVIINFTIVVWITAAIGPTFKNAFTITFTIAAA